jgi:trans-aconitate 2-methyltransferase
MSEIAAWPVSESSAGQYLKFERERTRPAADLLTGVPEFDPHSCIDLGCGPGNSTELLVRRFPGAAIAGLDRSTDMLARQNADCRRCPFSRLIWLCGNLTNHTT